MELGLDIRTWILCFNVCVCVDAYTYVCVCAYTCVSNCVYVFVWMLICVMYVMFVYTCEDQQEGSNTDG